MKKILYVTTISGFLSQFEKNDVKIMQEMGYEVHYASNFHNPVYSFDREELEKNGIVLHQIDVQKSPVSIRKNATAVRQIKEIIDHEQIDMIHCHNPMGGVTARVAAHISRRKPFVIYTAHGFHFYKGAPLLNWLLFYPAEKFLAGWTDVIVTINREDYERAQKKFRLKKDGVVRQIHSVGVDIQKFLPRPDVAMQKRRELGIPEDAFHIVTAAELNENKNQRVIIQAIAKSQKENVYYTICGKGPLEESLRSLIREFDLQERVKLLGFRTDMEEILQTADVFAFPSYREGLGMAAVEALASGVPLIAADNRGTREYAINQVNSIVCKADSTEEFCNAIIRMQEDIPFREQLKHNCRESIEKFSMENTSKIMKSVYADADRRICT